MCIHVEQATGGTRWGEEDTCVCGLLKRKPINLKGVRWGGKFGAGGNLSSLVSQCFFLWSKVLYCFFLCEYLS